MIKQSLRKVLLPTPSQTLGCFGAAIVLIGVLYRDQIIERIQNGTNTQLGQLDYSQVLSGVTNSPIIHTAVIVAFWSGVGLVAYTIVWSIINVMIEARNEVVLETEYTNKSALAQRIRTPLIQLALAGGLFVGLLAAAKWAFPYWLSLADTAVRSAGIALTLSYAIVAVTGTAATLYALLLFGQLVFWVG